MANDAVLTVRLYGQAIGTITHLGGERTLFSFSESYLQDEKRPTLGLRFKDAFGELIPDFRPYKMRLMPFFANLLPEGPLRKYLAKKANVHADREFFLLRALGSDLPGAVTVTAQDGQTDWPANAHATRRQTADAPLETALHFSLAGVQLKFSAIRHARYGMTIPASGVGGDWIVKLPAREFACVPENEFSMMSLAKMVGINVPAIDLADIDAIANLPDGIRPLGKKAFVIQRFDRNADGSATHIEDFAQVFDVYPEDKYKKASLRDVASVIAMESDHGDIAEFIRRLTFNVLIGNGDMHLKNWSLIYPDRRRARLAPAYDFVSTIAYMPDDKSALTFSRTKDFTAYTLDELDHLSAKAALPIGLVRQTAQDTVAAFMTCWAAQKSHLPLDRRVVQTLDRHLQSLPIAR